MLGFEGPPPFEFAFAEGLPTPPGEDELREVICCENVGRVRAEKMTPGEEGHARLPFSLRGSGAS